MKITWINPAPIDETGDGKTSKRICVRLRSMLPGDELRRRGHDVEQVYFHELPARLSDPHFLKRDVFVFGKAFVDFSPFIHDLRANGRAKVLIDVCDNVFAPLEDGLKSIYLAMLPLADTVVTSNELLAALLQDRIKPGAGLFSIPDAVEGSRIDPELSPCPGSIKLLWFGYANNLPLLQNELKNLGRLTDIAEVGLTVVTDMAVARAMLNTPALVDGIRIRYRQWSPWVMQKELKACDVVVIPSNDDPARVTKSANRVITAIWAGKFVSAYPLPSYQTFQPFAHIGRDLVSGVKWALENQDAARGRIAAGQQYIYEHFSIQTITDAWERVLKFTVRE